jgi:excisionase family DNA binding protein
MEKTIFTQLTETELKALLKASISESLRENQKDDKKDAHNLLSLKEAANYVHLAVQTLYGFTSQRTIPFIKTGKKLLFKKSDLDNWLNDGRKKTKKEIEADYNKKEKGGKRD